MKVTIGKSNTPLNLLPLPCIAGRGTQVQRGKKAAEAPTHSWFLL